MAIASYMVFSREKISFAISVSAVRETIRLPAITPVEEAPPTVAGVINLRGKIIPILDLDVCFGRAPRPYALTDYIIIMGREGPEAGVIVEDVHVVADISSEEMEVPPSSALPAGIRSRLVAGEAEVDGNIVALLDHELLLQLGGALPEVPGSGLGVERARNDMPAAEQALLRKRALNLLPSPETGDNAGTIPLAVVVLGREFLGIDLCMVREFSLVRNITPLPDSPQHLLGVMNLRGSVLTVADIREVMGMSFGEMDELTGMIVVSVGADQVGVAVEDIVDVMYLNPDNLAPSPLGVKAENGKYLMGTAPYAGGIISVLDLSRFLADRIAEANEET